MYLLVSITSCNSR